MLIFAFFDHIFYFFDERSVFILRSFKLSFGVFSELVLYKLRRENQDGGSRNYDVTIASLKAIKSRCLPPGKNFERTIEPSNFTGIAVILV